MDPSAILLEKLEVSYGEFIQYQWEHALSKHLFTGCVALLVYNYVLTVQEEWIFVWSRRPWLVFSKALYVIIRYFSLLWVLMHWVYMEYRVCSVGRAGGWIALINFTAVDLVLFMRVWLLYNLSRVFSFVIAAVCVSCLGAALIIRAFQPRIPLPFVKQPPISLTICSYSEPQEYFLVAIFGLISQVLIFIFLLLKMWRDPETAQLSRVLLLHAMVYFGIIGMMLSLNMISTMIPQLYVPLLESDVVVPISSLTCNQLILSLKRSSQDDNPKVSRVAKDEEGGS